MRNKVSEQLGVAINNLSMAKSGVRLLEDTVNQCAQWFDDYEAGVLDIENSAHQMKKFLSGRRTDKE